MTDTTSRALTHDHSRLNYKGALGWAAAIAIAVVLLFGVSTLLDDAPQTDTAASGMMIDGNFAP